jgi:hypothetical protein
MYEYYTVGNNLEIMRRIMHFDIPIGKIVLTVLQKIIEAHTISPSGLSEAILKKPVLPGKSVTAHMFGTNNEHMLL